MRSPFCVPISSGSLPSTPIGHCWTLPPRAIAPIPNAPGPLDHARELAGGPGAGSVLVQLSLSEGDVDAAWEAADRHGPGWAWQELATQGAEARPVAAADLYRPQLENDLQRPNTKLYPGIAATLATMAELYERGGRGADFALYIAKVRQDYGRRHSLMKALQAKGL